MKLPNCHPREDILIDYANGNLLEAMALVIATHLALCPSCRLRVAELEAISGAFLELETENPVSTGCFDAVLARLDEPGCGAGEAAATTAPITGAKAGSAEQPMWIPEPLRSYIGAPLADLSWQTVANGLTEADLRVGQPPVQTRLVLVKAGMAVPYHGHDGIEMTLVLDGAYSDNRGHFQRGDLVIDDFTVEHRPVADAACDCLCVTMTDRPLRFSGGLTRFLQPFVRLPTRRFA